MKLKREKHTRVAAGKLVPLLLLIVSCSNYHGISSKYETVPGPLQVPLTVDFKDLDPMPPLKVDGNRIIDENGNTVILRGLCAGEPALLIDEKHWNEDYFRQAASWGATVFRIPASSWSYHKLGQDAVFANLDQAIYWCKKYRMYAVIDWHTGGNIIQGVFPDPVDGYRTALPEILDFWHKAAERYKTEPTLAFYEIFNEPAAIEWKRGVLEWKQWRDKADEIIDVIYSVNPDAIPLVAGVDWAYDLRDYKKFPLRNTGIMFAVHPYAGRTGEPWEKNWEKDFGYLAAEYPMMFTEIGFDPNDSVCPQVFRADVEYGRRIVDFAEQKGISWTAWMFYNGNSWPMPLFKDWKTFTPTVSGEFFKNKLQIQSGAQKGNPDE
ncbi:MAG: cellulase family glycosylhydrolase [Spirochaetales bacterium]|nr:cellulase family glycosylhydrolase [Spirochaetales bacterium]